MFFSSYDGEFGFIYSSDLYKFCQNAFTDFGRKEKIQVLELLIDSDFEFDSDRLTPEEDSWTTIRDIIFDKDLCPFGRRNISKDKGMNFLLYYGIDSSYTKNKKNLL